MGLDTEKLNIWIDCFGVDDKRHVCKVDSDTCKCGVKVRTKKDCDVKNSKFRYSCYECTY